MLQSNFNRKFFILGAALAFTFFASSPAQAAKEKTLKLESGEIKTVPVEDENDSFLTPETYAKLKKEAAQRSSRKIAQADGSGMSKELEAFRDRFLNVEVNGKKSFAVYNAETVDLLLNEADGTSKIKDSSGNLVADPDNVNYTTAPTDVKFVAAQFAVLKAFKSFIYRVRPFLQNANVMHTMLLSAARNSISSLNILLPTAQWDAIAAYLTEPMDGMDRGFEHSEDLRNFYGTTVFKALGRAKKRMIGLDLKKPVTWDNQFLYGGATFVDGLDRYRSIGVAEQNSIIAAIDANMSQIAFSMAYSPANAINIIDDLGTLYGFDSLWSDVGVRDIKGGPSRDRVAKINKYQDFGKRTPVNNTWLPVAGRYFNDSIKYSELAWTELQKRPASDVNVMDPAVFNVYRRQINLGADNLEKIASGSDYVRSQVTGEKIKVSLNSMFDPKTAPYDLKELLPTYFEEGSEDLPKTINGQSYTYRNFKEGRAIAWHYNMYQHIFPDICHQRKDKAGKVRTATPDECNEDVKTSVRILSQVYGDGPSAMILGGLIL